MALKPSYANFSNLLASIVTDLDILAGNVTGPGIGSWQDVAGTLATNMEVYARLLHRARAGEGEAFLTFPDLSETIEQLKGGQR